jgi:hypothetical protein
MIPSKYKLDQHWLVQLVHHRHTIGAASKAINRSPDMIVESFRSRMQITLVARPKTGQSRQAKKDIEEDDQIKGGDNEEHLRLGGTHSILGRNIFQINSIQHHGLIKNLKLLNGLAS